MPISELTSELHAIASILASAVGASREGRPVLAGMWLEQASQRLAAADYMEDRLFRRCNALVTAVGGALTQVWDAPWKP